MLPLIPNVVGLETEEKPQPVKEVHGIVPWVERRLTEVPSGP